MPTWDGFTLLFLFFSSIRSLKFAKGATKATTPKSTACRKWLMGTVFLLVEAKTPKIQPGMRGVFAECASYA